MEGWFWRFTDTASGRVALALCGVNRHPDGPWATVAVAAHPEGIVRSAAVGDAFASSTRFEVSAGSVLMADERSLRVDLDDVCLEVALDHLVDWPLRLGGGGVFSVIPYLGQYWHPHVLGGRATGHLTVAGSRWTMNGIDVYAEKNWGAGFPQWWWWGQAQGFARPDVCVAFGGGRLAAGPLGASITGCVLRLGSQVVRFAPPLSFVRANVVDGRWAVRARRAGWRVEIEGEQASTSPTVLPVPLPAERRNVDRDLEHLAAHMRLRVWQSGSLILDDETSLAALEVGSTDLSRAYQLACSSRSQSTSSTDAHGTQPRDRADRGRAALGRRPAFSHITRCSRRFRANPYRARQLLDAVRPTFGSQPRRTWPEEPRSWRSYSP